MSNVPIIILKEGTEEIREREARKQNISAMVAIAETVRSTLGPKGMSKMLVDSLGEVTITNDGAEILSNLDIENIAANMMVNVAKSIDDDIGDGTTSAVIFSAALLIADSITNIPCGQPNPLYSVLGGRLVLQLMHVACTLGMK